jgi:hypothetical protein
MSTGGPNIVLRSPDVNPQLNIVYYPAVMMVVASEGPLVMVVYPDLVPVTVTLMNLARSADPKVYVASVAPLLVVYGPLATDARDHVYVYVVAAVVQVPRFAVNVLPTVLVPVIVGIGGVANVPAATTTVVAVFGVSPLPDFSHVTVTRTKRVRSSAVNTYVFPVAPSIGVNDPANVAALDH